MGEPALNFVDVDSDAESEFETMGTIGMEEAGHNRVGLSETQASPD